MLFIGGALVPSAPTKQGCTNTAHTPHVLKPHKRRQCAATTPVHANVRIINE